MSLMRIMFVICFGFLLASSATAGRPEYCAAYARDFADALTRDKTMWLHKYDIAQAACLGQSKSSTARSAKAERKGTKLKKSARTNKVEPDSQVSIEAAAPKFANLEPGSAAWNEFCAKKYTSFDAKTGTYIGKSGTVRKCSLLLN
jgi:hypothetical protein